MFGRNVRWTEDEYFRLEEASSTRHEYFSGEIYAMAGARAGHNKVATNTLGALTQLVRGGKRCQAFNSDQRIHVLSTGLYTYADGGVACGAWQIHEKDGMSLLNPSLVFEVLSPSTREYDRGAKLGHYKQIESLVDVLLIDEPARLVEHHQKRGGEWHVASVTEGALDLPGLGGVLLLEDVYYLAEGT
jgi:Uma2 family endonuclease